MAIGAIEIQNGGIMNCIKDVFAVAWHGRPDKLNFIKADNTMPGTDDIAINHISKLDDCKPRIARISSPITPFRDARSCFTMH